MEIPKLYKQIRPKGDRAYAKINGVKHYYGKWNTPEAVEKYQRDIAEWSVTKQALSIVCIEKRVCHGEYAG